MFQGKPLGPGLFIECFIFERVRLSSVIELSGTLYKKTRMEENRLIDPALKQPRRVWIFVSFITVEPVYNGPVLSYFLYAMLVGVYRFLLGPTFSNRTRISTRTRRLRK